MQDQVVRHIGQVYVYLYVNYLYWMVYYGKYRDTLTMQLGSRVSAVDGVNVGLKID